VWVLLVILQQGNKGLMMLNFFANLLTVLPSNFVYIGNLAYPTHRSSCFTQHAHISFQICLVFNDQWFSTFYTKNIFLLHKPTYIFINHCIWICRMWIAWTLERKIPFWKREGTKQKCRPFSENVVEAICVSYLNQVLFTKSTAWLCISWMASAL
jgi:hypothetical protein